jgi:hypothetical protein
MLGVLLYTENILAKFVYKNRLLKILVSLLQLEREHYSGHYLSSSPLNNSDTFLSDTT